MRITMQVEPGIAKALHAETAAGDAGIRELVRRAGGTLIPMHPGVSDPELQRFFVVEVPDPRVPELLDQLRQQPAVQAAYVKPPEALP
jgi:hypothetical protein